MIAVRRLPITLLELLIVMALLALIAGAVTIGIDRVLVDQRFRTEVSALVDKLRLAQDLMMIMGVDVKVKFVADDTGINYWLETDTLLPAGIQKQVQKRHRFKTVRGVFFINTEEEENRGKLDLDFFSEGAVMTKGILQLSISSEEKEVDPRILQSYICLPGYPRPIFYTDSLEAAKEVCNKEEDPALAQALTRDTFERLPDKVKKTSSKEKESPEKQTPAKQESPSKNTRAPIKP